MTHTCGGCSAAWTATGAAHCSACHRTFSSWRLFDAHRSAKGERAIERGSCVDPSTITSQAGDRVMFYRSDMWRGPEMTEDVKARRFGGAA